MRFPRFHEETLQLLKLSQEEKDFLGQFMRLFQDSNTRTAARNVFIIKHNENYMQILL